MNPRARQLAAIRHELTDRISVDAIHVEIPDQIAEYLEVGQDAVLDALGLDGRIVAAPYTGQLPQATGGVALSEWGTPDSGTYGYGTSRHAPLAGVESVSQVERYPWPDPAQYDYAAAAGAARDLSNYAVRGPYWRPLFCGVCDMMSSEEAMSAMLTRPRVFEAVLEHVYLHVSEYCKRLHAACGDAMPVFCLGDDFATQRGLMISPEQWRRYLKPRLSKLFGIGKSAGKPVWFHSCGDITEVLPDLIDIGMDVWETVQLHTLPISAEQLKRDYGREITFFGGVNTQRLPFATPKEVRTEVVRCIETLGRGGGYICGPDHHIKPDVPVRNAVTLFSTAVQFRREGYTR
jgi:uroporphyrinogen decarboxylase